MSEEEIDEIFNRFLGNPKGELNFSKGYKRFEELYETYKEQFDLKREETEEIGYVSVRIYK